MLEMICSGPTASRSVHRQWGAGPWYWGCIYMVTCKKCRRDVICAYRPVFIDPLRFGTVMEFSWSSVCSLLNIYNMFNSITYIFFFLLQLTKTSFKSIFHYFVFPLSTIITLTHTRKHTHILIVLAYSLFALHAPRALHTFTSSYLRVLLKTPNPLWSNSPNTPGQFCAEQRKLIGRPPLSVLVRPITNAVLMHRG